MRRALIPYAGKPAPAGRPKGMQMEGGSFDPNQYPVRFARGVLDALVDALRTREGDYKVRLVESRHIGLDATLEVTDGTRIAKVKVAIISNREMGTWDKPRLRKR